MKKRKFLCHKSKQENNSGIILIIVLWMLVILTMLAIGVGRRTGVDLALTKHDMGRLKADSVAWAGFHYALTQIKKDVNNRNKSTGDTLYQCGFSLEEEQVPEDILKSISVGDGVFDVSFPISFTKVSREVVYGMQDEESKINLNSMNKTNYKIFSNLLILLGFEKEKSMKVAAGVVDWIDSDDSITEVSAGAEDEDYMGSDSPYHCKNLPLDSLEEILLIKEMTPEILHEIKPYVTIFPKGKARFVININTVPAIVLTAVGYNQVGSIPSVSEEDVDSMVEKILEYRLGGDGQIMTEDDRPIDLNDLGDIGLSSNEETVFRNLRQQLVSSSRYIRFRVRGRDELSKVYSDIEAVVNARNLTIEYWRKGF